MQVAHTELKRRGLRRIERRSSGARSDLALQVNFRPAVCARRRRRRKLGEARSGRRRRRCRVNILPLAAGWGRDRRRSAGCRRRRRSASRLCAIFSQQQPLKLPKRRADKKTSREDTRRSLLARRKALGQHLKLYTCRLSACANKQTTTTTTIIKQRRLAGRQETRRVAKRTTTTSLAGRNCQPVAASASHLCAGGQSSLPDGRQEVVG